MCKCTIIFSNREMKLIFDPECLLSSTPLGKNDGRRMFFFSYLCKFNYLCIYKNYAETRIYLFDIHYAGVWIC